MAEVIDSTIIALRTRIEDAVVDLRDLAQDIDHQALIKTINDLQERLLDPFLFVIVGEVKAGKSSFINALLEVEEEICKVAPSPMTDTIQQIIYGDPPHEEIINPYLKKIYQPVDILREIAIVDTPGTNTIIEHHQEITERFIPGSDLIVFVFEAKNPYRQSAWDFFDFIHDDWRKKIIFVLQQKDLLSEQDLKINIDGVRKHAIGKGVEEPIIFAVSALQEQAGDQGKSGFTDLRHFIQENITGGRAAVLKLKSNINTAEQLAEKINDGLSLRRKQWEIDKTFRDDISNTLKKQRELSHDQVDVLVENLVAGYDRTLYDKADELSRVLSLGAVLRRSFSSIFSRKSSIKEWLAEFAKSLEEDLHADLRRRLNERVLELAESIQQMGQIVDLKLRSSQTILKDDHEIFSSIARRRAKVLTELQETFGDFLKSTENFTDVGLFSEREKLSPTVATGSGIAAVGVLLTVITNGMVFDVTGGVLTALGILFASVSVGLQKRKIMKRFKLEIDAGREALQHEVTSKLKMYVDHIRDRIDENFAKFDQLLASEEQALLRLSQAYQKISSHLDSIRSEVDQIKG